MLDFALTLALTAPPQDSSVLEVLFRQLAPDLLVQIQEAMLRPRSGCPEEVAAAISDLADLAETHEDLPAYFAEITLPWLHDASVRSCDGTWPTDLQGTPVRPAEYTCDASANSNTGCYSISCTCSTVRDCSSMDWICALPGFTENGFTCSRKNC